MNNSSRTPFHKERFIWIALSVVLTAALAVVFISPSVIAQSRQERTEELLREFEQVFRFVQQNYVEEVPPETLLEGAMKGLFESLDDPHSAYLDRDAMRDLTDTTAGEFGGVGIYISKPEPDPANPENESFVEVVSPIEGTPAFKAGVNAGDLITHIEGESTAELTSDEVVLRLRGAPGSAVTVTIRRGADTTFDVTLTRAMIEVPTVKYDVIPGGIAYLRIIQFTPRTAEAVRAAVQAFNREGYESLIVDLRSNPGGVLPSVIETADLFFSNGTIVSTKSRLTYENAVYSARRGQIVPDSVPIIVLIDRGSASAAEILAGALKDRNRATLVGETTYGKGSVQQVHDLGDTGFRLTMSRYYTPADISIDKVGISPDIEVTEPELSEEEQEQLSTLLEQGTIDTFVAENPNPGENAIHSFIDRLKSQGVGLEPRILKRLVRNAVNRTVNTPPVYDLEFDLALQEAVRLLRRGAIASGGTR